MKDDTIIPLSKCSDVNLKNLSNNRDIKALHETGHFIVMYALDMMDYFSFITIESGTHVNEVSGTVDSVQGLTDDTLEYKALLAQHGAELQQPLSKTQLVRKIKAKGAILYLPNICRLFGGGSICRYYNIPNETMCMFDYPHIDVLLNGLGLPGTREEMRKLVDMYLKLVFEIFEPLTKAIYKNLREKGTLNKNQVMQIIGEWEEFEPE